MGSNCHVSGIIVLSLVSINLLHLYRLIYLVVGHIMHISAAPMRLRHLNLRVLNILTTSMGGRALHRRQKLCAPM